VAALAIYLLGRRRTDPERHHDALRARLRHSSLADRDLASWQVLAAPLSPAAHPGAIFGFLQAAGGATIVTVCSWATGYFKR
jgi:hypothetical protein